MYGVRFAGVIFEDRKATENIMKIKFTFLLLMLAAFILPHAVYAETAQPATASVTVNGKTVNFCAYNIYGSNYFMLREVAAALNGSEKQFSIDWSNSKITLAAKNEYTAVGTEFLQKANAEKTAVFSVPSMYLDSSEITLIGYNIEDSNYFKIRDLARIFDFYIGYEDGCITIDTSKTYEPEMPYEPDGKCIGIAYEAKLALFINEMPIVSYYSSVDTAYNAEQAKRLSENPRLNGVYICALDLDDYGFDKTYNGNDIYLTRNKDKKFGILDGETINSEPSDVQEIYTAATAVYLDGRKVMSVSIGGKPYISAAELIKYGNLSKSVDGGFVESEVIRNRINIDFLEYELNSEFEAGEVSETAITWENYSNFNLFFGSGHKGSLFINSSKGLMKYSTVSGSSDELKYEYIGGYDNEMRENGTGILIYKNSGKIPNGIFYRGEFENGVFIDGIEEKPGYLETWTRVHDGYRTEGAQVNGYKREFVLPYHPSDNLRFGYRIIREGTIENGEYCGYYRQYDDNGKLIFEGEYSDYIKD